MIITRKKKIPTHWAFYAQLPLILTIYGNMVINAPFLLLIKRFIDNPAAILALIGLEVYITLLGGPFVSWLSDRIWTRYGRRKYFQASSDAIRGFILIAMPFAPNLWVLIILRWLYGFFGDLSAPTQALAYEIVPDPQRGRSAGFMSAFMQLGNLVFFWLLLGRFDDVYFMGPFSYFVSSSGVVVMFVLAALLLAGTAMFEFLGIKEIYPPGRKRLHSGRPIQRGVALHFFLSFFKDVFAKDLAPLYLLSTAFLMFSFSVNFIQPLLFVEQWGYSLQEMGNTIAVGVLLGIVISLFAGWLADRTSKMRVYLLATVGNLVINIAYTVYVYYLPDKRPSLFEIVLFGNLAYIFGATRGVVGFPLLMEYVARNRLGSATAGLGLYNALIRNSIGLLIGGWLWLWSWLFFPQAGYHLEAIFGEAKDQDAVVAMLEANDVAADALDLKPLFRFGETGDASMRWRIHEDDPDVKDLINEREDLVNEVAALRGDKDWIFTSEEEIPEIDAQIKAKQERMDAIDEALKLGAEAMRSRFEPVVEGKRFPPGNQIRAASIENDVLTFEVRTIEPLLDPEKFDSAKDFDEAFLQLRQRLEGDLQGPEHLLVTRRIEEKDGFFEGILESFGLDDQEGDAVEKIVADITVQSLKNGEPGARAEFGLDPRFMALFRTGVDAGMSATQGFELGAVIMPALTSVYGREADRFEIPTVSVVQAPVEDATSDGAAETDAQEEEFPRLYDIAFDIVDNSPLDSTPEIIGGIFASESLFKEAEATQQNGFIRVVGKLTVKPDPEDLTTSNEEEAARLAELNPEGGADLAYMQLAYPKMVATFAAQPVYVTVPRHTIDASHSKEIYEYFFSTQTIQIVTDIFGLLILWLIIRLEKRGTLHRYGAEEDQAR
ncbi:MAG: MFS transporter [Opitutales bacterium]